MSKKILTISTALALMISTQISAYEGVDNAVAGARMDAMKIIGDNMKTIGGMAQGKVTFDAAAAQAAIDAIAGQADKLPTLFKANETDPKSKASETIWANWDDFTIKAAALKTAVEATDTTSAAGLGQAMRGIGGSCQSCHMSYRLK
ncbi:MAG: c-type cytochrome [Paracoccaceae bacterium]